MTEYTWNQVQGLAAIFHGDSDMERDMKFASWIKDRKYRITSSRDCHEHRVQALAEGIEILIIKD